MTTDDLIAQLTSMASQPDNPLTEPTRLLLQSCADRLATLQAALTWQPIETLPAEGKFLIMSRAPTNWAEYVSTLMFYQADTPRLRQNRLRYANCWLPWIPIDPAQYGQRIDVDEKHNDV